MLLMSSREGRNALALMPSGGTTTTCVKQASLWFHSQHLISASFLRRNGRQSHFCHIADICWPSTSPKYIEFATPIPLRAVNVDGWASTRVFFDSVFLDSQSIVELGSS